MTRSPQHRPSVRQALQPVVELAAATVPGADYAGVTVLGRAGTFDSLAWTHEMVLHLDRAQGRLGEGPCREVLTGQPVLCLTDTAVPDPRWPRFVTAAHGQGIRSVLACRLPGDGGTLGSLNLHAREPGSFCGASRRAAALVAAHAALAISQAALVDSLGTAVASRQTIGEATGMLMERYRIGSRQAFAMLVRASQHRNVKLRDIAAQVVETGSTPEKPAPDFPA